MVCQLAILSLLLATIYRHSVAEAHARGDLRTYLRKPTSVTSSSLIKPRSTSNSTYLNNATAPFSIDGSSLPYVEFDIGESYAGLLPIGHEDDKYFFWFVPSLNTSVQDEVVIWLNGGPGCSSLDGFLHANGPFTWQPGTNAPVPNTWAWSNLTNVVWVDQPQGTGYSVGEAIVTSEGDVAKYFVAFWEEFVKLFGLQHAKVYLAGESYAGKYVPYIADAMLDRGNATAFDVSGILLYDPGVGDDIVQSEVPMVAFMNANPNSLPFDDTFKTYIQNTSAACGYDTYLEEHLRFPPLGPLPSSDPGTDSEGNFLAECDIFTAIFEEINTLNPCFNIYQINQPCPIPWDVLGFPYSGYYLPSTFPEPYFNLAGVKAALNVPASTDWTICSSSSVFVNGTDSSPPSGLTGGPLERVIEKTMNVIVANGALDMSSPTNGTLLVLQNMTWNGARGFSNPPVQPLLVPSTLSSEEVQESMAGSGHLGSWVSERGLTFCEVFLSGHQVPEWQPSVAYRHIELLLGRIENLSDVRPFTKQQ
ncbi:hypothetical protein LTR36_002538 [Oleoguttula mirabilis]|uniref:Carboxypeptidase n=1 Tax=Oleoguttula mirabilis TaxID=1507867 RepID=A0AAV9JKG9_9PEZI|nr:hypothetical protein LTR36_002538 [Oleoguttula mirabilis]